MRYVFLVIVSGLSYGMPASAQSVGERVVHDIQDAYSRFDYEEAERKGQEALDRYSEFTVEQLTDVHTILALVAFNQNDLGEARRQFVSALQLTPDLTLDPLLISPKILDYFDHIAAEIEAGETSYVEAPVRYVLVPDRRTDAALRSMLVPGWGQFFKGHSTKGFVMTSAFAIAVGGAVFSHVKRERAEAAYRDETRPDRVSEKYETLNRWHKSRRGLIQAAALTWVVSYVDALLTHGDVPGTNARVGLRATPQSISFALHF